MVQASLSAPLSWTHIYKCVLTYPVGTWPTGLPAKMSNNGLFTGGIVWNSCCIILACCRFSWILKKVNGTRQRLAQGDSTGGRIYDKAWINAGKIASGRSGCTVNQLGWKH